MNEPLDYSGHQPSELSDLTQRPVDKQEVRGYGIRASDFRDQPNPETMPPVRVARDKAQYVRQQKGHSWILHWCVLGIFTLWIVPIYYSFSPNHYWHI